MFMRLSKQSKPAQKIELREDALAYFTYQPSTKPLVQMDALQQMYAYWQAE